MSSVELITTTRASSSARAAASRSSSSSSIGVSIALRASGRSSRTTATPASLRSYWVRSPLLIRIRRGT